MIERQEVLDIRKLEKQQKDGFSSLEKKCFKNVLAFILCQKKKKTKFVKKGQDVLVLQELFCIFTLKISWQNKQLNQC